MTREEFQRKGRHLKIRNPEEPQYQCPKCGGDVYVDYKLIMMVKPQKHKYYCSECKYKEFF